MARVSLSAVMRAFVLKSRRATAMLETALAFPVLLLVAIGLVQFALFTHAQAVVLGAVQDGARVAAADGRTVSDGVSHAEELLRAGLGRSAGEVRVQGSENRRVVLVQAEGILRMIIPWVGDSSLPIRGRAAMAKETFQAGPGN